MANKKFSEFVLKTSTSDVSHIVGYNGAENVQITPANFLDTTGGPYLPLAGGTMVGNTTHNDNVKSIYGTSNDGLEIYHDSLNSVIRDSGTGNLVIAADDFRLQVSDQTANMISANTGAEVNLMYNGGIKLATTNTGISVTGDGTFTGDVIANTHFNSSDSNATLSTTGAGNVFLRPNGKSVTTGQMELDSSGNATFAGNVISRTGLFCTTVTNVEPFIALQRNNGTNGVGVINLEDGGHLAFDTGATGAAQSEKMRLDASGNLGVGGVPVGAKLEIHTTQVTTQFDRDCFLRLHPTTTVDSGGFTNMFFGTSAVNNYGVAIGGLRQGTDGVPSFSIRMLNDSTTGVEVFKITNDGNVGIGTPSPLSFGTGSHLVTAQGDVGNNYGGFISRTDNVTGQMWATEGGLNFVIGTRTNHPVLFSINNQEKMRLTSTGDLLVGLTSSFALATHDPNVISSQSFGVTDGTNLSSFGVDRIHFDASNFFVLNQAAIGVKLVNGATAWTAQSDESLKENIKPLENVLDKIKDYRCVEYNLKAEKTDKKIGFIAQDWEQDFDAIVDKDSDGILSMKYTETIPVLLKAIQELSAKLEALECQCEKK
jgi:hypothetical protein